jgi:hypothetical protein
MSVQVEVSQGKMSRPLSPDVSNGGSEDELELHGDAIVAPTSHDVLLGRYVVDAKGVAEEKETTILEASVFFFSFALQQPLIRFVLTLLPTLNLSLSLFLSFSFVTSFSFPEAVEPTITAATLNSVNSSTNTRSGIWRAVKSTNQK